MHNRSMYTHCDLQLYVYKAEIFALLHPQIYVRVDLLVHGSGRAYAFAYSRMLRVIFARGLSYSNARTL